MGRFIKFVSRGSGEATTTVTLRDGQTITVARDEVIEVHPVDARDLLASDADGDGEADWVPEVRT